MKPLTPTGRLRTPRYPHSSSSSLNCGLLLSGKLRCPLPPHTGGYSLWNAHNREVKGWPKDTVTPRTILKCELDILRVLTSWMKNLSIILDIMLWFCCCCCFLGQRGWCNQHKIILKFPFYCQYFVSWETPKSFSYNIILFSSLQEKGSVQGRDT